MSSSSMSFTTLPHLRTRQSWDASGLGNSSASPQRRNERTVSMCFGTSMAGSLPSFDCGTQSISSTLPLFAYFGVHDNLDLREIPWRRGQGYDLDTLSNVLTADHA